MSTPTTTDLLRNIGYGKAFWDYGFAVYDMTAFDLSPWPCQFLWQNYHYPYPPMTLLLYALIASIHTSLPWGKIILTLFDGLSTWAIGKASGDRWLALLYWLNPLCLWFTSREGQFEGYEMFCVILAIWALQRKKTWAYGLYGMAIQTKFFPILLAPLFLERMSWRQPKQLAREFSWGIASLLPSAVACIFGGFPAHLMEKNYVPPVNPLTWTLMDPTTYADFPFWLIISHALASVGFLFFCLYGIKRTNRILPWLAPMLFVILIRSSKLAQFWYFMILPAFCFAVEDRMLRRILFAWCLLFGLIGLYSILVGPIGYQNPPDAMILLNKAFWGF